MKHQNLLIGAVVLIITITILFLLKAHILTSPFDIPSLKLKKTSEKVITLSEKENSGVSGGAKITEENDKARILVNLVGTNKEDIIYMHIHTGSCPEVGKVLYDLNSIKDGASQTELDMNIEELKEGLPLAINVHKYENKKEFEIACGNIIF